MQIDKIRGPLLHKHGNDHAPHSDVRKWTLRSGTKEVVKNGTLYNWLAVTNASPICASNAHVPSLTEMTALYDFVGGEAVGGGLLKSLTGWTNNVGALDTYRFNLKGSGYRNAFTGVFNSIGTEGYIWTSTSGRYIYAVDNSVGVWLNTASLKSGMGVRLIVDTPIEIDGNNAIYVGNDERRYNCVLIDSVWWTAENIAETKYRNGSLILEVTDNSAWTSLTTGGLCAYSNDWTNVFQDVNSDVDISDNDILEVEAGDNIGLELTEKKLKVSAPGLVHGPATAVNHAVCVFDGTTGKLIKLTNVIIDDSGRINILGGEATILGLKVLQLPTGTAGIDAGLSVRTVAGESIVQFGNNLSDYYTGAIDQAKSGAMIRLDTRDAQPVPGGHAYSAFQIQVRVAGSDYTLYKVPVQIAGGAPEGALTISTTGVVSVYYGLWTAGQITSTLATGTPPLVVASETLVTHLNADLLDGHHADYFSIAAEVELMADNETELLAAWTAAVASNKAARIYITNNITFTASRQFVNLYGAPGIKIEAIQSRWFIAGSYTIDFNNVTLTNIVFRTTGASYLRVVGGVATFNNCGWIDDTKDASVGGSPKKNIIVLDPITAGAAKIILRQITHFTATPDDNNSALIQPFWIENQATFTGDNASLYIECLEMAAVSGFDRFARILLTSTVADCPYKVTGDESWFYAPAQEMPGSGNIKSTCSILRTTTVDKFNAARLVEDDNLEYVIGMNATGYAYKRYLKSDDWYGIQWDTNVSSPLCTRIGNLNLHRELPLQSKMRGCILNDDGTVNYYLDALDWTKKEDGSAANHDGSDGQVMVEIPPHYRKFESFISLRRCKISEYSLAGYTYVPKFYIGAYEAALQRSTSKLCSVINLTTDYRGGDNTNWDALSKTTIGRPATTISRIDFRTYARARGASNNWNMLTYDAYKSLFWLYFIEYANLNSQSAFNGSLDVSGFKQGGLGNGVTNLDGTKWNAFNGYNPFIPCGHSDSLGNASGEISFNMPADYDATILTTKVNRYRGVENPFGHIWKWIDGINIETQSAGSGELTKLWVCSNPANFSNTDYANYTLLGNLARTNDYIKEMLLGEIMPSVMGTGSTTYFCDFGYLGNIPGIGIDLRGVVFGGAAYNGADAGFGFSNTASAPSAADPDVGSRLCFLGT